jgi:hypothetical protein
MPRTWCFVVAALAFGLEGCTFVGAGIGAGVDAWVPGPYESTSWDRVQLERYDRVVVFTREGERVDGSYLGVIAPTRNDAEAYILLDGDDGLSRVAVRDVRSAAVEVPGKGWLYGGAIGLAVDVAVVVGASIAVSNMSFDHSGVLGDGDCFC